MAQNKKQGVREVRVVFETDDSNFQRTDIHWMDRVTNALAQVKNTNFAVQFLDENGHPLRKVEFGEPSREMKKLVDYEFGEEVIGA